MSASKNSWVCSPAFLGKAPLPILHRERDKSFSYPEHPAELVGRHTLFRQRVWLASVPRSLSLTVSADDFYKLYINGIFVAEGPASAYHDRCYTNTLDVGGLMTAGENVIAVHVYYHGAICRSYTSGDLRQGLWASLSSDGEELLSDRAWLCRESTFRKIGRTLGYATAFSEDADYREAEIGWTTLGYDDSDWLPAPVNPADDHVMLAQPTPTVEQISCKPTLIRHIEGGVFLDFGREITARLYVTLVGRAGDKLTVRYGEELDESGRVRDDMRCGCLCREEAILRDGKTELDPFDYKAFRYVELLHGDGVTIDPDSITAVWRRYPFDEAYFSLKSSDPLLAGIIDICRGAVINCTQEGYFDCPQRERGQYLGDLVVTGHSQLILTGDGAQFRKALLEFAASSRICPGLMAVTPGSLMQEIADYSLLYPYAALLYHRYTGDIATLREIYPVICGMRDWFRSHVREDGLICDVFSKWNLVDWPKNLRDGYDAHINDAGEDPHMPEPHNVICALYAGMEKNIGEIESLLGIPSDSRYEFAKAAFISAFYDPEQGVFVDRIGSRHSALQSNLFPLFFDLLPDGALSGICRLIGERGLSCGVYTAYFLLHGLARVGEYGLLWSLLRGEGEHSWVNMLREDATCTFEAWGKEQKWNTSLCHAWASAPISLLVECLAGLSPADGGFVQTSSPHFPSGISVTLKLGEQSFSYQEKEI